MSNDNSDNNFKPDPPAPPVDIQQNRQACVQAFQTHDYPRCAKLAFASLQGMTSLIEMRLLLVSLLRMGDRQTADEITSRYLIPLSEGISWERNIILLIWGQIPSEQVIANAKDDVQKCEAHFYTAMRLLLNGETENARVHLLKIMELDFPESYEFLLAAVEHEALPKPPAKPQSWWKVGNSLV